MGKWARIPFHTIEPTMHTASPSVPTPSSRELGASHGPARPHLDERSEYVPRGKQEMLIVPVIARAIRERFNSAMPAIRPGDRALDVGCGRQPLRRELERLGLTYISLDTQQNPDCPVDIVGAIDGVLPAEVEGLMPFRFILCTEVLEHVADWDAAFANFTRLLGPGGRILITAPFVYSLHERPYDFWRPTMHAVEHFARRHGLRVVESAGVGEPWDVLGTAAASMSARPRTPGLLNSAVSLCMKMAKEFIFRASLSPWVRRRVEMEGQTYQSTLAILEKP